MKAALRERWLLWLLLVAVCLPISLSLGDTPGLSSPPAALSGLWLGLLVGVLLTYTRFSGWGAAAYSLTLGFAAAAQAAGRVLPPLSAWVLPLGMDRLTWLNLRVTAFGVRMGGWWADLRAQSVPDRGLWTFLAAWGLWCLAVWLVWWVLRRQNAYAALLPLGLALIFQTVRQGQSANLLWAFGLAALALIAHCAFLRQAADWQQRGLDTLSEFSDWALGAVAALVLLAGLARLTPLAATPQGWDQIRDFFNPPPAPSASWSSLPAQAAQALTPIRLEAIGQPPPQDEGVVLWVRLSDPPPPPPEAGSAAQPPRRYWRSAVYDTYTGQGWLPLADAPPAAAPSPAPPELPPDRTALTQEIGLTVPSSGELFAANDPVQVLSGAAALQSLADGSAQRVRGTARQYTVLSHTLQLDATQLRFAGNRYPPEIQARYLQLPPSLPRRVVNLASQLAAQDPPFPYDRVLRVQAYLRAFPYTLDTPPPGPDQDAVDYYLFDARAGFCSYAASAMTVLLRAEGIPARVVSGYAMGQYDFERGAYRVPASAAHAWVEVYFPGYGWVEFEPTAAFPAPVYPEPPTANRQPSPTPRPQSAAQTQKIAWGWLLGAVLLGAAAAFAALRRWRPPPDRSPTAQASRLYAALRRELTAAGVDVPAHLTPWETLRRAEPHLQAYPHLAAALRMSVQVYIHAAYRRTPPSAAAVRAAQRAWARAWGQRLLLRLRRRRKPAE